MISSRYNLNYQSEVVSLKANLSELEEFFYFLQQNPEFNQESGNTWGVLSSDISNLIEKIKFALYVSPPKNNVMLIGFNLVDALNQGLAAYKQYKENIAIHKVRDAWAAAEAKILAEEEIQPNLAGGNASAASPTQPRAEWGSDSASSKTSQSVAQTPPRPLTFRTKPPSYTTPYVSENIEEQLATLRGEAEVITEKYIDAKIPQTVENLKKVIDANLFYLELALQNNRIPSLERIAFLEGCFANYPEDTYENSVLKDRLADDIVTSKKDIKDHYISIYNHQGNTRTQLFNAVTFIKDYIEKEHYYFGSKETHYTINPNDFAYIKAYRDNFTKLFDATNPNYSTYYGLYQWCEQIAGSPTPPTLTRRGPN